MKQLNEAATIKARAKGLLKAARALLDEKTLPKALHEQIDALSDALKKNWADLEAEAGEDESPPAETETETTEAARVTKTEDGKQFPASDYAYVPDPEKSSTWKLRLTSTPGGDPDPAIVGAAAAALGAGFRGQKVQIPEADLETVKTKVRAAWKKANPDKKKDEMPTAIQEADRSQGDVRNLLSRAIQPASASERDRWSIWIRDIYDSWFVYSNDKDGKLYKRTYVIDDKGAVTMGDPSEVIQQTVYVPVAEAAILESEYVPLLEKAVSKDNAIKIKVIAPGWGSSGYYSSDVLKRDGPKVFGKGTKMYWDHPTPAEEAARPERSLRDLAGELASAASWDEKGKAGPGLYADAKVFEAYKPHVEDLASHIGTSIRALGRAKPGQAEGRQGSVIEEIVAAKSIDFVTMPGAGGQILQLFESARQNAAPEKTEVQDVNEQEAQALREANAALTQEVARLKEGLVLREARALVEETLGKAQLPDSTRKRLIEAWASKPVLKDGKLDKDATVAAIGEAVKAEIAYLAEVVGLGEIRGMGSTGGGDASKAAQATMEDSFKRLGLSESAAKLAAQGRR